MIENIKMRKGVYALFEYQGRLHVAKPIRNEDDIKFEVVVKGGELVSYGALAEAHYAPIGGGVESGESLEQAIRREMREEFPELLNGTTPSDIDHFVDGVFLSEPKNIDGVLVAQIWPDQEDGFQKIQRLFKLVEFVAVLNDEQYKVIEPILTPLGPETTHVGLRPFASVVLEEFAHDLVAA